MPKPIVFEIKKFKSFTGNEGLGFNADLYMDGKKACFAYDDASGGPICFQWESKEFEQKFKEYIKALPIRPLGADAEDWEKKMYPNGRTWSDESFIATLIDRHAQLQSLKRGASKKTLAIMPNRKRKDEYVVFKCPFSPENKALILKNPKNAGAQFINEHLEDGKWAEMIGMEPLPVPAN